MNICRKIMVFVIVGLFFGTGVISGFSGFIGFSESVEIHTCDSQMKTRSVRLDFSKPTIASEGDFVLIEMNGTDSSLFYHVGEPIIPFFNQLMTFPLGTDIIDVQCTFSPHETMQISKKIMSAFEPESVMKYIGCNQRLFNNGVYESQELYPLEEFSYHTGGGLNNGSHVTLLSLYIHPIRYNQKLNYITYAKQVDVTVTYRECSKGIVTDDQGEHLDLLIISPSEFNDTLEPLVEHKNRYGVKTKIVNLEHINISGLRDKQEEIKWYIKASIENHNISYVLLVGGREKIPVRYSYTGLAAGFEPFISDLYYSDVYTSNGSFSSWDTNNNNKFGELNQSEMIDIMDLYPDVYIGRLLCSNMSEATSVVQKIIDYEEHTYGQEWFNNIILCGGDTFSGILLRLLNLFPRWDTKGIEGEIVCDEVQKIMDDFNPIKFYASALLFPIFSNIMYDKTFPTYKNINEAINQGAGFVLFSGHGTYNSWITNPPIFQMFLSYLTLYDASFIDELNNDDKLPIIVMDACSCGDFSENTGISSPIAWDFVKKQGGGAIASIASTTVTKGGVGEVVKDVVCGYFTRKLFEATSLGTTGGMIGQAQINYLNSFSSYHHEDCLIVEEFTLFGDPSLKIGGYE